MFVTLFGATLGDDTLAREIEELPRSVDVLEIVADGFLSRPSPYVAWLARTFPLVVRAPHLPLAAPGDLDVARISTLSALCAIAQPRLVVVPLGFRHAGGIDLLEPVPAPLTGATLKRAVGHVRSASGAVGALLVEPVAAHLDVPGEFIEPTFLAELCAQTGTRVLLDVATLLSACTRRDVDPRAWLNTLGPEHIGALRISGARRAAGGWVVDATAPVPEEAWDLLGDIAGDITPRIALVGLHDASDGGAAWQDRLARLRRAVAQRDASPDTRSRTEASLLQPRSGGGTKNVDSDRHTRARTPSPLAVVEAGASPIDVLRAAPAAVGPTLSRAIPPVSSTGNLTAQSADRPLRFDNDVALFVLDDAGVCFSERRRELSLFNTAATLVWCLVEEGLPAAAIVDRYGNLLALDAPEATRQVGTLLQQWFALGYLTQPVAMDAETTPFETALAQLLTNPRLRAAFRLDPGASTRALRVEPAEAPHFTRLDPDQVDAQAAHIDALRSELSRNDGISLSKGARASRHDSVAVDPAAAPHRAAVANALSSDQPAMSSHRQNQPGNSQRAEVRLYRVLETTMALRVSCASSDLTDALFAMLAHMHAPEDSGGAVTDVTLTLEVAADGTWSLTDATGRVAAHGRRLDGIGPGVKQCFREYAIDRHDFLLNAHAAAVEFARGCVLLPACAGSGKSTLAATLISEGATYLSDELAPLDRGTLAVRPVPLALTIKDGSLEPLRTRYPHLDALPAYVREDHVTVRYLPPPHASLPGGAGPRPVRWIVFPRYDRQATTALLPLSRPEALRRLLDESFIRMGALRRHDVEALVRWMRGVDCYELPMSSVEDAARLVRALVPTPIPETL